jgi:Rrf2 family protein
MFRISRRVDYGLKLLIALAKEKSEGPQPTARLAEKLNIPLPFLHQIGRSLIQAGMIKASPGPGGGLRINKSPENISLRQIMETLEGPIILAAPTSMDDEESQAELCCPTDAVWKKVQATLVDQLSTIHLDQLLN